jgi:hypothetical protein
MAALNLSLDEYFSLPEGSDEVPVKERTAGKDGYTDHKALGILNTFLQPTGEMCLETAANSIVDLLPAQRPWTNEALSFASLCYEVALHIPWDHPSQLKLAWLVAELGWSKKFTNFAPFKVFTMMRWRLTSTETDPKQNAGDTHLRHWFFTDLLRESWDNARK